MNFLQSLAQQFTGKPIDWDELEEALIRADLGVSMTMQIIKTLQEREAWALLRRLPVCCEEQNRLFALRHGWSSTHQNESHGRAPKGETHTRQTRFGCAA